MPDDDALTKAAQRAPRVLPEPLATSIAVVLLDHSQDEHPDPNIHELAYVVAHLPAPVSPVDLETLALFIHTAWCRRGCDRPQQSDYTAADALLAAGLVTTGQQNGVALIAAERRRQVEAKGYDAGHDKQFRNGELINAAICYAATPSHNIGVVDDLWPWEMAAWKPTPRDRIRELTKAAALLAAEIDRLKRAEGGDHGE